MKISNRLLLWCFVAVPVLALGNPYIYTDFHELGFLFSIQVWAATVFVPLLLATIAILLSLPTALFSWFFAWVFSRRRVTASDIRFLALCFACVAIALELGELYLSWHGFLRKNGTEGLRICIFSCPPDK